MWKRRPAPGQGQGEERLPRRLQRGLSPAHTLIPDFQPLELGGETSRRSPPPRVWPCVTTALGDWGTNSPYFFRAVWLASQHSLVGTLKSL